ncbi:hypothetical protein OK351_03370 [Glutamicibacter sp. MNS18]|uniref:hypothetical protein n=1 Tax=Glutamicibacter sp. MNS18 TaxID=2989817 RepID=UPI0022354E8F|nr:hypothetical protein [Glutamicibacter sp. MNS18]MCW4464546.1 hypothetical protein [Glutamicibacter sp. MNS18]
MDQWQAVPRTIPDWVLVAGSWIPLLGLFIWSFMVGGMEPVSGRIGSWPMIVGLVTLSIVGLAAGRLAPWVALVITGALLYITGLRDGPFAVPLQVLAVYFLTLGLAAAITGFRFCLLLRGWRLQASRQLSIDAGELKRCTARHEVNRGLAKLASGAVAFGAIKAMVSFLGDARLQVELINPEHLETLVYGLTGLLFWVLLVLIRVIARRFVGHLVLSVPVHTALGSPIRFGALSGVVLRSEAAAAGCACAPEPDRKPEEDDEFLNSFVKVDDNCETHGIEAVNSLGQRELIQQANQPWIFGEHVHDELIPVGSTIRILGLSGWGSRPVRLMEGTDPAPGHRRDGRNIYPYRVREVLNRQGRRIRWRGVGNESLEQVSWDAGPRGEMLNSTPLSGARIAGAMVRVEGERPYFVPEDRSAGR